MTAFAYYAKQVGIHVHVRIFAGPDEDHRANCGSFTMRTPEWIDFCRQLTGPDNVIVLEQSNVNL